MDGAPKENANPVVLAVEQRPRRRQEQPLGYEQVRRLGAVSSPDWSESLWPQSSQCTPAEQAVFRALQDVSTATNGRGINLLRNAGAVIPSHSAKRTGTSASLPRCPVFIPVATKKSARTSPPSVEKRPRDPVDSDEIFEIIRNIQDPEHPLRLEQLGVVSREQIVVHEGIVTDEGAVPALSTVEVRFTPTIPHCSMATLIGLCIRVKLLRSLPARFVVTVLIQPGTHVSEKAINKQLADKERVCAALENKHLLGVVNKCIQQGMTSS